MKKNILIAPKDNDVIDDILSLTKAGKSFDTANEVKNFLNEKYQEWLSTGRIKYHGITNEIEKDKRTVLIKTILFSLGFSSIFIILGMAVSFIGNVLLFFSNELRILAGLIIIIFSLQLLGFINLSFLNQEKRIHTKSYKNNYVFPFVVGAAFAFGWTPCIGPVLGSILALSATEATISKGFVFDLGSRECRFKF